MNRRSFLKNSALSAGLLTHPFPIGMREEKINIAILGTGWWGRDLLLTSMISTGKYNVVGLCDVNQKSLELTAETAYEGLGVKPMLFSNYKEMYAMEGLEAVAIATPTHWHALQFIDACKTGLHVFLEKPISYDIREGQAMLEAHRKASNIVCVDFPRIKATTNDEVKAFIDSGEAGVIRQVQANIHSGEGPLVEKEIPSHVDFETFCGPAPKVKYLCNANSDVCNWRGQYKLSRGIMADWGIHYIHDARRVLGLGLPDNVSAIGGNTLDIGSTNPDHLDVRYQFDGLPVHWTHKSWGYKPNNPDHNIGVYYYGEKATIFAADLGWEVYPDGSSEVIKHGDVRFRPNSPEQIGEYKKMMDGLFDDFAEAVHKNSNELVSTNFEEAFKTTSSVIYGDMAYRVGASLNIDNKNMDILNHDKAYQLLKRKYRPPYKHPYVG